MKRQIATAVFGGGCFWCTEAVFTELHGVKSVVPGYAGGQIKDPTYEQVSTGNTGHAEVAKIEFNPREISYQDLLVVFFATHDSTTPNRQGNDVGPQYRSIVLYSDEKQKKEAENFIRELDRSDPKRPVVTEVKQLDKFYPAEENHREYYLKNPNQPYCQIIIGPKLEKLKDKFYALFKQPKTSKKT